MEVDVATRQRARKGAATAQHQFGVRHQPCQPATLAFEDAGRASGDFLRANKSAVHFVIAWHHGYSRRLVLIGLDHFIVAVPDPDEAAAELERLLGLRAGPGGRHAEYGSFNRLLWLGDSYIELLGIDDRGLAADAWFGPKALQVLDGPGAGYIGMSLATDDIAADMRLLDELGTRLRSPEAGERRRPDGRTVRWKVATMAEADPELGHLFLIEHDSTAAEWTAAERAARAGEEHPLGGTARMVRVELPVGDMPAASMRLHRDLGLRFRPSLAGGGARDSSVGSQTLRLVPVSAESGPAVVVRGGAERREVTAFGCRWMVEPAAGAG
jgi:hypothetical protein